MPRRRTRLKGSGMWRFVGQGRPLFAAELTDEEFEAAVARYASGWPESDAAIVREAVERIYEQDAAASEPSGEDDD